MSDNRNELHWFPMRVTYNRELKVKASLDQLNIKTFLPIKTKLVERNGHRHFEQVPAIHNLLFVHSTRDTLTGLKMTEDDFSPLRYMMTRPLDPTARPEVIHIPEREMENFIRVASITDDRVMFLDYSDVAHKVGRRVIITEGDFAGIEGTVKRVKKNRHVVIQLEGVAAVALAYVPSSHLKFLE